MLTILRDGTRLLSKLVLFIMGWSLLDKPTLSQLTKNKRAILIFSHTSYADFYIVLLYLLSYPNELSHVRMLVKPEPFKYLGWILRAFGGIPATKVDDKQGGAVDRIVSTLKESPMTALLISPKGTIIKRPWRSGYYHIATGLDANLMVAGLDYEKKCVIISPEISSSESEDVIKTFLEKELSQIVPLFPEEEIVPIREHNEQKRSIIDHNKLYRIIIVGMMLGYLLY